jgi:hypothetical protein
MDTPTSAATIERAHGLANEAINMIALQRGRHVVVTYRIPGEVRNVPNTGVLVSVNPAGGSQAPLTEAVPTRRNRGRIRLPFSIAPQQSGVVLMSLIEEGRRSSVVSASVE